MYTELDLFSDNHEVFANDALRAVESGRMADAISLLRSRGKPGHEGWAVTRSATLWHRASNRTIRPPCEPGRVVRIYRLSVTLARLALRWMRLHETPRPPAFIQQWGRDLAERADGAPLDVAHPQAHPGWILARTGSPTLALAHLEQSRRTAWHLEIERAWLDAASAVHPQGSVQWQAIARSAWTHPEVAEDWLRNTHGRLRELLREFDAIDESVGLDRMVDFPAWACIRQPDLIHGAALAAGREPADAARAIPILARLLRQDGGAHKDRADLAAVSPALLRAWLAERARA